MKYRPYIEYQLYVHELLKPTRRENPELAVKLSLFCNAAVRIRLGLQRVTDLTEHNVWGAQHTALEALKLVLVISRDKHLGNIGKVVSVRA